MTTAIDPYRYSVNMLNSSSQAFKNYDKQKGFEDFKYVYPSHQHKVYEQIWVDRGMPQGNPEYGNQTFNDTNGLSSTMQEKAEAIDGYLRSVGERRVEAEEESQNPRNNVMRNYSGYSYTWRNGEPVLHPAGLPPPIKTDEVWIPTTKDECLQVGIVCAAVGAVATTGYAVYKCFEAIKGAIIR
jgi:hypothetical protein